MSTFATASTRRDIRGTLVPEGKRHHGRTRANDGTVALRSGGGPGPGSGGVAAGAPVCAGHAGPQCALAGGYRAARLAARLPSADDCGSGEPPNRPLVFADR